MRAAPASDRQVPATFDLSTWQWLAAGNGWSPVQEKVEPMGNAYEIYAIRYATMSPRTPHLNYLVPDPHETTAQDLDYFVWLIRGHGRDILVDTGFNAAEAQLRGRKLTLNPVEALARFGVKADAIKDIVVTHPVSYTHLTL